MEAARITLGMHPSVDAWQESFTGLHGAMQITVPDRDAPWTGRLDVHQTRSYGLALCSGGTEFVSRQARHIRADARGRHELLVPLAGVGQVEQGSDTAEIRPGTMVLCDLDRPLNFAHGDDFLSVAFIVPPDDVAARSRAAARESQMLDGNTGLGRIVRQLATTMQQECGSLTGAAFDLACDRLLDLVCLAAEGDTAAAPAGQRATVEAEIQRYVRRQASDPDLDVTSIGRSLGWSTRYIQQVLQAANTTPRDLIRRERLLLARSRLASADWASSSIARIAQSCGFGSHATFTTAFRAEFGMAPRDARS
jgi:AraC-like DNA-binding protein